MTLIGWLLVFSVLGVALRPMLSKVVVGPDGGREIDTGDSSAVVQVGIGLGGLGTSLVLYFWAFGGGGGLAGGPASPPSEVTGPPNAPIINLITAAGDSVTFRIDMSDFAGSQDDTHDSTRIMVDSAGKDFTTPLVDSIMGPQTTDTVSHPFAAGGVYDFRALYRGASGGWSDTSAVFQKTITFDPDQITTLSVVGQSDSSLTLQWVTVHNGQGAKANHTRRYKNTTGDTASFNWGGPQEFASEVFDSLGSAIGDTVSVEVVGLTSGDKYEFGIKAYSGEPNVDAEYGATSNIASGTVTGTPAQDTTDTPTLETFTATSDTSKLQMGSSGFVGGSQTHDSTRWRVDNNSDMSSPFHDVTSTGDLTSHLVTDNANLDADATYYGTVQYFGSLDASQVSEIVSVVNTAPTAGNGGANEPAGMTTLIDRPFNSLSDGTAWNFGCDGSPETVVSSGYDGTPPISPPNVLRMVFKAGNSGGNEMGNKCQDLFGAKDTLYMRIGHQMSSNWQGHQSDVNKVIYLRTKNPSSGSGWQTVYIVGGVDNGELNLRVSGQQHTADEPFPEYEWNDNDGEIVRGAWHDLEFLFISNTPGSRDGILRVWKDGQRTHNYTNVGYLRSDEGTPAFNGIEITPVWGGVGDQVEEEMYQYLDHVYVSGKD